MKKGFIHLVFLAIVSIIGMNFISCSSGNGTFTLTNIPSQYNGMYAYLEADLENSKYSGLVGTQKLNVLNEEENVLARISNGKVSIPLWVITDWESGKYIKFSDNDKAELEVTIFDSSTMNYDKCKVRIYYETVVFSNGKATKSFLDADDKYDY